MGKMVMFNRFLDEDGSVFEAPGVLSLVIYDNPPHVSSQLLPS